MLYVVTGFPGAGKTTWVQNQAQYMDVIYDLDMLANAMCINNRNANAVSLSNHLLKHFLEYSQWMECNKYIIRTVPTEKELKEFDTYNARYILIDTPMNVCKTRRLKDIPWQKIDAALTIFKQIKNPHEVFMNEERW